MGMRSIFAGMVGMGLRQSCNQLISDASSGGRSWNDLWISLEVNCKTSRLGLTNTQSRTNSRWTIGPVTPSRPGTSSV